MGDSSTVSGKSDDPNMVELKAKITVVAVLVLFLVMFFIFLLHFYIKWYRHRRREELATSNPATATVTVTTAANSRRLTPSYQELALRRGLDSSMLKTIPVVVFSGREFKDGFECSVCLCQLNEGEKARFLPKCNHGFHVECIDMWFQSHSSCPICRNLIASQTNFSPEESNSVLEAPNGGLSNPESSDTPPNFPTNVLFWGNDFEVRTLGNYMEDGHQQVVNLADPSSSFPSSSSSSRSGVSNARLNGGAMVIDVPQQVNEDEEPKSPAQTRFRSLKRLLSKDCRRVGPCNSRDIDVELASRS